MMFIGAQIPKAFAMPICFVPVKAHKQLTDQISPPRNGSQNMLHRSWLKSPCVDEMRLTISRLTAAT